MLAHELRNPLNVAEIYLPQVETDDSEAIEQVVRGDANYLQHLLENLFCNAVEHSEGEVTVRLGEGDCPTR